MLGGDPESDISRAHAAELLETAVVPETKPARRRAAGPGKLPPEESGAAREKR
jgi:hypothetical protein